MSQEVSRECRERGAEMSPLVEQMVMETRRVVGEGQFLPCTPPMVPYRTPTPEHSALLERIAAAYCDEEEEKGAGEAGQATVASTNP